MKHLLKSLLFFLALTFLITASVYGSLSPDNTPVREVSVLQISPHEDGLSLYQGFRGKYYTVSPFNDYEVYADNSRGSFISQQEILNKQYKSTFQKSHLLDLTQTIEQYVGSPSPRITFKTQKTITYQANIKKNTLSITRDVTFPDGNSTPRVLGTTLSYTSSDIVYDKDGNVYDYDSRDDLNLLNELYGVEFILPPIYDIHAQIKDGVVFIVNRFMNGVIVVQAKPGQRLWIDKNSRLLEIEEEVAPKNEKYTNSITIKVFTNPQEAEQSL
jgi:hypothetical protein